MADFQPFRALRFDPAVAGDPRDLISPPYDVVSPEQAPVLYARSPFNVARVDFGERLATDAESENRYTRAGALFDAWLAKGALIRDADPAMYVYDQDFTLHGRRLRRRAIFGRLRLEEWEKGIVLPHEFTGAADKADRLALLRATRVHVSPIFAMYDRGPARLIDEGDLGSPVLDATLEGERHTLRRVSANAAERVSALLSDRRLYVADGHHRYETALAFRDEVRARAPSWSSDEPEDFVLAALVAIDDPGLVVLPTHRLLRMAAGVDLAASLETRFSVADFGPVADGRALERLLGTLADAGRAGTVFGSAGLAPGRLHLLRPRDPEAVDALVPQEHAVVWRRLDVNILEHVLYRDIGYDMNPDTIAYREDAAEAVREVASESWTLAFLLNATPVSQVVACSDAGERMPRKTTYFYPKLATGMVMYPLDAPTP